ncbi:hypothetical protein C5B42_06065 [Candidatus Cerribacteria bacterium 'Amazon FNV 2010 28 9']|uniref:S1 motif domain-containing protein n=1 Tax=Candidatus Cerribacteria bacterium 'Amazon FNV 2010 28 9' TaxID=2081795 RepID=A0A317JND9_9BACT|nr:MAG: hypothetical protein C5B42_06065 [Candidatus Cerribacteria bacterium 'Amazon FNV 2010 28 9']
MVVFHHLPWYTTPYPNERGFIYRMPSKKVKKNEEVVSSDAPVVEAANVSDAQAVLEETPTEKKTAKKESSKKESAKKPMTMDELLASTGTVIRAPKKGSVMSGTVTDISRRMVQVDIGGKTEGVVADKEFEAAREYIDQLHVGDKINVYVVSAENERGQILLSLKKAAQDQKWDIFKKSLETGEALEVRGVELNKGGMIVTSEGIRGFVPTSQFGKAVSSNLEELLGKAFKVKVIEVDRTKNRLIFSERHVSEEALMKQKTAVLDAIKVGEIYTGTVSGILPYGAFVSVTVPLEGEKAEGKIEGLVHISEISWEKVDDPNRYLKTGEEVKVKVLSIDAAAGKLNLSIKQTNDDPWVNAKEKYTEGSVVKGTVSRIASFGVFVNIEPGIDGLIHISKIMEGEMPIVGDDISVTVESVDPAARRMSLSITPTEVPMGYK